MRRVLVFLVSLVVFTIFFARPAHEWVSLGTDREGIVWQYDRRTLRRGSESFSVVVRNSRQKGERFRIDTTRQTIQNLTRNTPPEPIPPGSIADNLLRHLRE